MKMWPQKWDYSVKIFRADCSLPPLSFTNFISSSPRKRIYWLGFSQLALFSSYQVKRSVCIELKFYQYLSGFEIFSQFLPVLFIHSTLFHPLDVINFPDFLIIRNRRCLRAFPSPCYRKRSGVFSFFLLLQCYSFFLYAKIYHIRVWFQQVWGNARQVNRSLFI